MVRNGYTCSTTLSGSSVTASPCGIPLAAQQNLIFNFNYPSPFDNLKYLQFMAKVTTHWYSTEKLYLREKMSTC